jgi:UDP-N-acetyl-D-glucosamine 2-epimerase, UDP-hydrolysing
MKRIVFITGTRADYGKLKSLMLSVEKSDNFELHVYVTGMHMLADYGETFKEVLKDGYSHIYIARENMPSHNMSADLGKGISNFTRYVSEVNPDCIVVHGDRGDALMGSIVGAFNNIRVIHIEGGEVTGTIDESIRHAITRFAHIHLVANEQAKELLLAMGEHEERIKIIGSPDIDIIKNQDLPTIEFVKEKLGILYGSYSILLFHPVVTEVDRLEGQVHEVIQACKKSEKQYVVIYPNNDQGSQIILNAYKALEGETSFTMFSSIKFEDFLVILQHAECILGNSSAGVREAPYFGVPTIDIGSRQRGRYTKDDVSISHVECHCDDIVHAIQGLPRRYGVYQHWGRGNSADLFIEQLDDEDFWKIPLQKSLSY